MYDQSTLSSSSFFGNSSEMFSSMLDSSPMRQQSLWGTMPAAQIKPRTPNIIKTMIRRESYSKHTKNDLQQSMFDLNTHLLKDRLGSRILPWHCAEDEFESALTGGYANYTNNRFPYTAVFSTSAKGGHLLAIGSEDGRITVLDTQKSIDQEGKEKYNDKLQFKSDVHQNAIFDLLWNNSDAELITASGDRTLKIVDTETQNIKLTLRNHTGSVKSVSAHDSNPNILVSSSRDGSLCLWDTRESTKHSDEQFDDFICSAHTVFEAHKLIRKGSKRKRVEFGSSSSVTSVKFFGNTNTIISAGASDGCVKLWDLRTLKERKSSTIRKSIVPLSEFSPCVRAKCDRPYGIISLDVSLDASQILMSASNHRIYVFESAAMETGEFQTLHGHTANSFYVKAKFTANSEHVIAGSSDCSVYSWQIRGSHRSSQPITTIQSHDGEINGIDCCRTEFGKFATCSDDSTVRVYSLSSRRHGSYYDSESSEFGSESSDFW